MSLTRALFYRLIRPLNARVDQVLLQGVSPSSCGCPCNLQSTSSSPILISSCAYSSTTAERGSTTPNVVEGSLTRSSDGLEPRRARLLYQSQHRGIKEMDLVLGLTEQQLDDFDALVNIQGSSEYSEWDIYYWITDAKPVPPEFDTPLFALVKEYAWTANTALRASGKSPTIMS